MLRLGIVSVIIVSIFSLPWNIGETFPSPSSKLTLRERMEECVSDLRMVGSARLSSAEKGYIAEVDIVNRTDISIYGLMIKPVDERLIRAELDDPGLIEFDGLAPDEGTVWSQSVNGFPGVKHPKDVVAYIAIDIVDSRGDRVIERVFSSIWPEFFMSREIENFRRKVCQPV